MSISWQPMAPDDYADFQRLTGTKISRVDGLDWREVRTGFYRPLQPFHVCDPSRVKLPRHPFWGGVQYPVATGHPGNSYLNRLSFENDPAYKLESLHRNWKRKTRAAAEILEIRPITDVELFKRQAYPVYLSFYARTRYPVGAYRRDPGKFATWADALFKIPHVLILGGFSKEGLGGISLSFLLNQVVYYATFFCDDHAMRQHLPDLMIHTVRTAAASNASIREVYCSMYKGGGGLDDFYMHRGAKLLRQPALLTINPMTRLVLEKILPRQYQHLLGRLPDDHSDPASAGD